VSAFKCAQLREDRLPRWRPILPCLVVSDVEVSTGSVCGQVVVPISEDSSVKWVDVETVAARGVGDDGAVLVVAQVVDPRRRGIGSDNNVLFPFSRKMSIFQTDTENGNMLWIAFMPFLVTRKTSLF
jgi:hypothetical protein